MIFLFFGVMAHSQFGHEGSSRVREAFKRDELLLEDFEMKRMTYRFGSVCLALVLSLSSVACGNGEKLTADNVTLEECESLFEESDVADSSEEAESGDYDDDGDEDEDDEAIAERCDELLEEADGSEEGSSED